jgi:malate dehydrogenase (oxaloacetate-decarboxylating)
MNASAPDTASDTASGSARSAAHSDGNGQTADGASVSHPHAPHPDHHVAVGIAAPILDTDPAFAMHRGGKIELGITAPLRNRDDLSLAYTPGVARVCMAIAVEPELADVYTWRANTVAVVTDGTAVLGLGDIGPAAAMPVMEGKALLFKHFAGVDAVPICLDCTDTDELFETVVRLAPSFGGINLEDISAPRCFELERRLQDALDIPVFHDDQHGTAIVVLAAMRNAAKLTGRSLGDLRVVVSGAGAAGIAVAKILLAAGIGDIGVADSKGMLHTSRTGLTDVKADLAAQSNKAGFTGTLEDALAGADVFLGLSAGKIHEEAIATMAPNSLIFAMANPDPEVDPVIAAKYAAVVATGRSDFPNQINNVLAFPGVFRGAFQARARRISEGMKLAAADALAAVVGDDLAPECVIPSVFDERVAPAVSAAVAQAARDEGLARA